MTTQPTLYVGDLSHQTLETDIFRLFNAVGKVTSVKVIRLPSTCYAYVNFENHNECQRALKDLSYATIHNRQIRVLPFHKHMQLQHNIIVKNLPANIDNKTLFESFSVFGEIYSAKVETTTDGLSKRFGYVCYTSKKAVKAAIKLANNTIMNGHSLKVAAHLPKKLRETKKKDVDGLFTNVYCKNFDLEEQELKKVLSRFGQITSFHFPRKHDDKPKGVAFCNYESNEMAKSAIKALHDKSMDWIVENYLNDDENENEETKNKNEETKTKNEETKNKNEETKNKNEEKEPEDFDFKLGQEPFYIQRAQNKHEREEELRSLMKKLQLEGQSFKKNLYVTNIPWNYNEKELQKIFTDMGGIITNFLLREDVKTGKKYAYICYSTADEASIVMEKGNDAYLDGNKLNIQYFKTKKERQAEKEERAALLSGNSYYSRPLDELVALRSDKRLLGNDLYTIVLKVADSYSESWGQIGVRDEFAFADKVTKMLMNKPDQEIRNMIGLGTILTHYIDAMLCDMKKK